MKALALDSQSNGENGKVENGDAKNGDAKNGETENGTEKPDENQEAVKNGDAPAEENKEEPMTVESKEDAAAESKDDAKTESKDEAKTEEPVDEKTPEANAAEKASDEVVYRKLKIKDDLILTCHLLTGEEEKEYWRKVRKIASQKPNQKGYRHNKGRGGRFNNNSRFNNKNNNNKNKRGASDESNNAKRAKVEN